MTEPNPLVEGGPLADVRIVDLTQMLAGPYATMLLADMGADVLKVEPPTGDMTRPNEPHLLEEEAYGGYFHSVNRNKRSIAIDLKADDGRAAFRELVAGADVVVENFRTGTMERLGLPYETLSELNPKLVYVSIRGFGDPRGGESPYADRPAFDLIAQAMGGIMSITGTDGPTKVGPGVGDIFPATLSAVGLLAALREADRTGEGQYVDVGMVDGILSLCERIVHQHAFDGEVPGPQGNSHPLLFPFDRFETTDGYIVIAAPNADQWEALCEQMGRPELAAEYAEKTDRIENADRLRPIVNEWTAERTKEELFELLEDDVPCGPVNDVADIFEDPHFEARSMLETVTHADTGREVTLAGTPVKFPESHSGVERRAPFLGEHSTEILREIGYGGEEIDELLGDAIIEGTP